MRTYIEMAGRRFGWLVVLHEPPERRTVHSLYWHCLCDCGKTAWINGSKLRRGHTRSCGCLKNKRLDLAGQRFGKLTALRLTGFARSHRKDSLWLCRCDCGREVTVHGSNLRRGNSTTCGCSRLLDAMGEGNRRDVIRQYREHARKKKRAFTLTGEQLDTLFRAPCHYCGSPPANVCDTGDIFHPFVYSGIDRLDNAAGYVPGNVVSCCRECNFRKGSAPHDEFIAWVLRAAAHLQDSSIVTTKEQEEEPCAS